jgi:hypothetical protein
MPVPANGFMLLSGAEIARERTLGDVMADWDALRGYIKSNYKVADDRLDALRLLFDVGNGRSQAVIVNRLGDSGWVEVSTAVCNEKQLDPRDALRRNNDMIVGGLAMLNDGTIIFRHSFPLANLDPNEFEEPLDVAVRFGDKLERELSGADVY